MGMGVLETVPKAEYLLAANDRIHESKLAVDGLYTAFFSLKADDAFAIKFNARVLQSAHHTLNAVSFVIVDADLRPQSQTWDANITDGFIDFSDKGVRAPRLVYSNDSRTGKPGHKDFDIGFFNDYHDLSGLPELHALAGIDG